MTLDPKAREAARAVFIASWGYSPDDFLDKAITAYLAALPTDGWRLIADDPPPTDGNSFFCGWWNADHTYWWTCKAHWANGAIDGGWDGAREPIEVHPTHWQPLPAPPQETR